MNYLRVYLLLFIMASIGLYAGGDLTPITKDSAAQKELNLSVTHKDSQQDQNKVMITVTFKGGDHIKVNLINSGKNVELKTVVKDGMVSMSLEIEKNNLEKSLLKVTNTEPRKNCESGFLLYLNGYVA